jgi:CRP-like cAMP-binding protein
MFLPRAILVGSLLAPVLVTSVGLAPTLVISGALSVMSVVLAWRRLVAVDRTTPAYLEDLGPRIMLLQSLAIFQGMPAHALEAMTRASTEEQIGEGEVVIRQGDPPTDFFVVKSGILEVLYTGEAGTQATSINTLGRGDYFGEIGLLERLPRTATVRAASNAVLYRISGDAFLDAVTQAPVISGALLGGMMTRLARTHPSYRVTSPPTSSTTQPRPISRSVVTLRDAGR